MSVVLRELTETDVVGLAAGEPDWLRDRRLAAFKAFSDFDWPDVRVEEFRYTDPRRFDLTRPLSGAGRADPPERGVVAALGDRRSATVRIVDGAVVEATSAVEGVTVGDLRQHVELVRDHLGSAVGATDKFTAANLAAWNVGAVVHVGRGVELREPVTVGVQVSQPGTVVPRVVVVAEAQSKATVYVDHGGDAPSASDGAEAGATVVEVVECVLGEGAQLRLVTAQSWGDRVAHIGSHTAVVGSNAEYRHLEVTLGGKTVYLTPNARLDGPGAHAELLGVYFTDEGQHVEHRSLIHHNASHTTSELVYKGALQGRSRATWFGNLRIEPHAKATASDETNRNLILTDGAKADSIPFLEIENSDVVKCGHHSSVGQVDEEQLFYLEARGIPRDEAAKLLVFGFFGEVTDRIDLPGVTKTVLEEIEREIRSGPTTLMAPRRR